jgi:hypothetical protein
MTAPVVERLPPSEGFDRGSTRTSQKEPTGIVLGSRHGTRDGERLEVAP